MEHRYTVITASADRKNFAMSAAAKLGIKFNYENKPTCIKQHSIALYAGSPEQCMIVDEIILATTAWAGESEARRNFREKYLMEA